MDAYIGVVRTDIGDTGTDSGGEFADVMKVVWMPEDEKKSDQIDALIATPDLADALESEQFRRFLDQIPIAIVVSEMKTDERIVYANPEFEKLSGQSATDIVGQPWDALRGHGDGADNENALGSAIVAASDFAGTFNIDRDGQETVVIDLYSNVIENDAGIPCFRLAALVDVSPHEQSQRAEFERQIREKDTLLLEIQHRVKNNLQMITALIRIEARNARGRIDTAPFDRLAGRIEAIGLVYQQLSDHGKGEEIDLGLYLTEIATAVLRSHAVEGIRLDLKVDAYPVSVNVAMPTGLVVNELLLNALKHAFAGRDHGTITVHCMSDADGCRIIIADDGVGLPDGTAWPQRGKLSALIVKSLRENAKANLRVDSPPGEGMRVTIVIPRPGAAANAAA
jgi:PAS domain S-box-containing protein